MDENFGLHVPQEVAGVPSEVFRPRDTWADKAAYDTAAKKLAGMLLEMVLKADPEKMLIEGGRIVLK